MKPVALTLALLIAAPIASGEPPVAELPPGEIVVLEPLSATPRADALYEGDALLRALLSRSTPCLGCDARARPEPRSLAGELLHYLLLPAIPAEPDEASRLAFEIKLQDSPDLEYLRP